MLFIAPRLALAAELPAAFVGQHCFYKETENQEIFTVGVKRPVCEGGYIYIFETESGGPGRGACDFDQVEKIESSKSPGVSDAYRVHANCKKEWSQGKEHGVERWTWRFEIQIIEGYLVITDLPEG
jgi:hypothetical protein